MADYSVKFVNDPTTKQTWTMAIYQTIPNMGVFDNVSWKQASAPPSGSKSVGWALTYNAALADFFSEGDSGVYESSQVLASNLGQKWLVTNTDGTQQLAQSSDAVPDGYIYIANTSGLKANVGIGMSGVGSVYQKGVLSGSTAQFKVTPRYWASIFNKVVAGEVISTAISATDPVEIVFAGGITAITLTAWVEGQTLHFGDRSLTTSSVVQTPMALVNMRSAANREAHAALEQARTQRLAS
jgi:hypothetical protein